ncbi:MAG TPA: S-layer homology domain-containing protein [Leptolyngbyaceae cyanobacterium]
MTNSPTPDRQSSDKSPLGFDEFIGILVAFSTIGTIFFWVTSRKPEVFNFKNFQTPALVAPTREEPKLVTPTREVPSPVKSNAIAPTQTVERSIVPRQSAIRTQPKVAPVPIPVAPPRKKAVEPVGFQDVSHKYWAHPFIISLQKQDIVNGLPGGYFKPNQPLTRSEFAVMLASAFNPKNSKNNEKFKDIPTNFWATPAISKASGSGFLEGYPGNIFRPKQSIPRVQAIVALANGLNLKTPVNPDKILKNKYKDAAQIPAYAKKAVAAATQAELIVNHPNPQMLKPNQKATRAEVAALVHQALAKQGKVQKVNSKFVVKP